MQVPKIPSDETDRLLALYQLELLDTPPDASLDRITRLAAHALDVPTLLISLVDADRLWFKSCAGMDATPTSREVSFCGHAIYERRPLVVSDATADPRFADNPLVIAGPCIRAYLGIPLCTLGGHAIGTLCALDVRPREFTEQQISVLVDFAKIIEETLQAQESALQLRDLLRSVRLNEQIFRDTFESAAVGIVHTTLAGRLTRINQRTCAMLGYNEAELRNASFIDLAHPDDVAMISKLLQQIASGDIDDYRLEGRVLKKDGDFLWVHLAVTLKRNTAGDPDFLIAVIEDISAKKQTELDLLQARDSLASEVSLQTQKLKDKNQALRTQIVRVLDSERERSQAQSRLRAIANSMPAMIGYWNRALRCEFANSAYRDWFPFAPEQIIGMTMEQLLGKELFKKNEPAVRMALSGHEQRFERTLQRVDGTLSFVDVHYVPDLNEAGETSGFYVLVTDVSSLRRAHAELEEVNARLIRDSATDYLTGIANRRVFSEQCEQAAKRLRAVNEPYGLVLLDVDNFKNVNDTYGHEVGDQVLIVIGRVLKEQLRGTNDIAARLGGEEFAILCFGDMHEESLRQLAERIRSHINAETICGPSGVLRVTCSFGVAQSYAQDLDWKSIYARADSALYEAKAQGKDRVIYGRSYVKGATGRFRSLRVVP